LAFEDIFRAARPVTSKKVSEWLEDVPLGPGELYEALRARGGGDGRAERIEGKGPAAMRYGWASIRDLISAAAKYARSHCYLLLLKEYAVRF